MPRERPTQSREIKLAEFTKLAPPFIRTSFDPADAEYWINDVEKAFSTSEIPEAMKVPLVEFQLKERAND